MPEKKRVTFDAPQPASIWLLSNIPIFFLLIAPLRPPSPHTVLKGGPVRVWLTNLSLGLGYSQGVHVVCSTLSESKKRQNIKEHFEIKVEMSTLHPR